MNGVKDLSLYNQVQKIKLGVNMTETKVYVLIHAKETKQSGISEFGIGTFSSLERAIEEKKKRENVLGFKDYPEGFRVEVFVIDKDICQEIIYL